MSCVSGQTQSLPLEPFSPEEPGFSTVHLGKGLSDADDRVSLPDLDDPDLYVGLGAASFPPRTGLGLAEAVSSTHCVGFGSLFWI